jgi:hypothetical protein
VVGATCVSARRQHNSAPRPGHEFHLSRGQLAALGRPIIWREPPGGARPAGPQIGCSHRPAPAGGLAGRPADSRRQLMISFFCFIAFCCARRRLFIMAPLATGIRLARRLSVGAARLRP